MFVIQYSTLYSFLWKPFAACGDQAIAASKTYPTVP